MTFIAEELAPWPFTRCEQYQPIDLHHNVHLDAAYAEITRLGILLARYRAKVECLQAYIAKLQI